MDSGVAARAIVVVALLIAGGCDQASSDLATIKTARSLAAERALVARLNAQNKLRPAYSQGMQRGGVEQIVAARSQLSQPDGEAGHVIGAVAALPDDAGPLWRGAHRLAAIETQREDH